MRITIIAVGRLRHGPERDLIDDYVVRFNRTGQSLGLGPLAISEVEDRRGGGASAEAQLLQRAVPDGALLCALDERGRTETSPQFAKRLADWRDDGTAHLAFVVGGADGIDRALRDDAAYTLSFGAMVWPHKLARVMLVEQLYRAASILAGSPYHRA